MSAHVGHDPKAPPASDPATVRVPLIDDPDHPDHQEPTPPPLPPSPASAAAENWFEDAPTRPSALTDIAPSLPSRSGTLSDGGSLPGVDPAQLRAGAARPAGHMSWGMLGLVAVTALVVGVVIGALIFRGGF
jgi:hypothetical protein